MIELEFFNKTKTKVAHGLFRELAVRAQKILVAERLVKKTSAFRIEVSFVGNKTIQLLNATNHGKDRPTDVISLSYFQTEKENKLVHDSFAGEIFISVPYARTQAKEIGQSLNEELRFLFVHGLLHVFGYDHMKPKEEAHMKKLAYVILRRTAPTVDHPGA